MSGQYLLTWFFVAIFAIAISQRLEIWLKKRGKSQKISIYIGTLLFIAIIEGFDHAYTIHEKPKMWLYNTVRLAIILAIVPLLLTEIYLWYIKKRKEEDK